MLVIFITFPIQTSFNKMNVFFSNEIAFKVEAVGGDQLLAAEFVWLSCRRVGAEDTLTRRLFDARLLKEGTET